MSYRLVGSSLEACTCEGYCPCWAGHENQGCGTVLSWHIEDGSIEGVDVSGRAVAIAADALCSDATNRRAANATLYVDEAATPEQRQVLSNAWTGKLGGPVADLAALFGEMISVKSAPISFGSDGGKATLAIGQEIEVDPAPLREAEGRDHTMHGAALSPDTTAERSEVPGSRSHEADLVGFRFEA